MQTQLLRDSYMYSVDHISVNYIITNIIICLPDNGLRYITFPKDPDPPFSLQKGKGTGMMSNSINVSAFMVLPDFAPPTSATFFLMAASHIRPSFELFI